MHDGRLAGMMVMLTYAVHRIVCRGSHFVHPDNGAVTNGAAIVPRHVRADGNGFESFLGRCHVYTPELHDLNSVCQAEPGASVSSCAMAARHKRRDGPPRRIGVPVRNMSSMPSCRVDRFRSGHIPGAAQIDWTDLGLADTTDPSITHWQADIEQKLSRLGISRSDTVLIYDDGTLYAPRLWWILDQLGHRDKRILNGGLIEWTNAGGKIEKG